jgi:hypothetical protein
MARKKLYDDVMANVTIRLPRSLIEAAQRYSDLYRTSVSAMCREALEYRLKSVPLPDLQPRTETSELNAQVDALRHWRHEMLDPALMQLDEQVVWLTQHYNELQEKLDTLMQNVGGLAVLHEQRLAAIEELLSPQLPHDPDVEDARARGKAFLDASEITMLQRAAQKELTR